MMTMSQNPSSSQGYWRGSAGLSGPSASPGGMGVAQGVGNLSIGTGSVNIGSQAWHPSVLYLLGLVIVEMIAFRWIGQILK